MQVWDILRAIQWAATEGKLPVSALSIYARGEMGILAMYAALFDKRIQQIVLNDPPASHWQRPALLNVLRVTDVPQVVRALEGCRLVSLTKPPLPNIRSADSLPEALEIWKQP
jgi:hypothetical protein